MTMNTNQNLGYLLYIVDYTSQLHKGFNKPL